jgi:hypothetical protein
MTEVLNCQLSDSTANPAASRTAPSGGGPPSGKTVGDAMLLACEATTAGPTPAGLSAKLVDQALDIKSLKTLDASGPTLYVIDWQGVTSNGFKALVTSHQAGEFRDVKLVVGPFELSPLSWTYQSVLPEAQKIQKETMTPPPENVVPFPVYGPFTASYPWWLFVGILVVACVPLLVGGRWWRKRAQKMKLVQEALEGRGPAVSPMTEFGRAMRLLTRDRFATGAQASQVFARLDEVVRTFVLRRFQVPAFQWSEKEILTDLRRHHRSTYDAASTDLYRLLRELRLLKNQSLSPQDLEQVFKQAQATINKLDRSGTL